MSPSPASTFKICQVGLGGSLLNHDLAILLVTFLGWRIRDPSKVIGDLQLLDQVGSLRIISPLGICGHPMSVYFEHACDPPKPPKILAYGCKKNSDFSIYLHSYVKSLQVALVLPTCLLGKAFQDNKHFQKDGPALDFKNDGHIPLSKPLRK